MKLTYEQVNDLLHAYAIGALEADEMDAVDEYFDRQQALIDRLTRIESATVLLAQGSTPVAVKSGAKDALMDRVHADLSARNLLEDDNDSSGEAKNSVASNHMHSSRQLPTGNGQAARPPESAGTGVIGEGPSVGPGQHLASLQQRSVHAHQPLSRANRADSLSNAHLPSNNARRGFFSMPALTNAALAASLAGLLFISFLYVRGEQKNDLIVAEADGVRVRLAEAESQIGALNQTTIALRTEKAQLVAENEAIVAEQADLAEANLELASRLAEAEDKIKVQNVRNLTIFAQKSQVESQLALYENQVNEISGRLGVVGAASQATVMFGTDEAPGLQGTFFHASEKGELVIHGLKPLPEEQTYQFWLVTESGEQVSAGIFGIEENQEPTWVNLNLPQDLPQYTLAGISIEPASGSDVPTGPMLLESGLETEDASDTLS